jgi:hypothetical protein
MFHLRGFFMVEGSACGRFRDLHPKAVMRVLVRRRIDPGVNRIASDFDALGDLEYGMPRHPDHFRDCGAFFHSNSLSAPGSEVKSLAQPFSPINRLVQLLDCIGVLGPLQGELADRQISDTRGWPGSNWSAHSVDP